VSSKKKNSTIRGKELATSRGPYLLMRKARGGQWAHGKRGLKRKARKKDQKKKENVVGGEDPRHLSLGGAALVVATKLGAARSRARSKRD